MSATRRTVVVASVVYSAQSKGMARYLLLGGVVCVRKSAAAWASSPPSPSCGYVLTSGDERLWSDMHRHDVLASAYRTN